MILLHHMDPELKKTIEDQQKKIDMIYVSVEKTRKYFLWVLIVTIALSVLPLIGILFAIPSFIGVYDTALNF